MPTLAGWPSSAVAPMPNAFTPGDFDVIELPILLPEWQVNALEVAARERGMTIGQLLRRLFSDLRDKLGGSPKLLFDSDASEQSLHAMATERELGKYRYLHLATHGEVDNRMPLRSGVILSRDHLPDAAVDAGAKRDMARDAPRDVKLVRAFEPYLVAIG